MRNLFFFVSIGTLALIFTLVLLAACASMAETKKYDVQTPYWGLDLSKNALLGVNKSDDMPLTTCNESNGKKSPCVVVREEDFFHSEMRCAEVYERLKACEKNEIDR
jgi:hypothetical protein